MLEKFFDFIFRKLDTGVVSRARPTELTQHEPQVGDKVGPLVGGCQVITQKAWPWAIVGDVFGECHAPCT